MKNDKLCNVEFIMYNVDKHMMEVDTWIHVDGFGVNRSKVVLCI